MRIILEELGSASFAETLMKEAADGYPRLTSERLRARRSRLEAARLALGGTPGEP